MAQLSNLMRWAFLVVAFVAHGVFGDDGCTVECQNGICANETATFNGQPQTDEYGEPFDFLQVKDVDGQSCVCDEGWTDVLCATQVNKCENSTHACYYGGVCVDGIEEGTDEEIHVCDCRNAVDNDGINYLGAYCQKPSPVDNKDDADAVPDSVVCDEVTMRFCINGGSCVDSFIQGKDSCNCPDEYTGYHCEFHKTQLDQGNLGICSMDCQNGGTCQIGYRNATDSEIFLNPDFDPNVPTRFEHCQCPDGFAGEYCEQKFSTCGDDEDMYCAFGTCETVPIDDSGNEEVVCACNVNLDESYAGIGCGVPASSYCTWSPGVNGRQFCTNNGTCTVIGDGLYNCTCTGGYHGPHCEFADSVDAPKSYQTCSLICQNGGFCAEGRKDYGMLTHIADIGHLINNTFSTSLEHCVCATGYTGDLCEHVVQVCADNQHVCFHGSECVDDDGGDSECDCDASQDSARVSTAGEYCQYKATVECDAESGVFCVNNGVCHNGGCDCPEPFRGPRCEFKMQIADIDGVNNGDLPKDYMSQANSNVIIVTGVMAALAILAIVAIVHVTGAQAERYDDGINVPPVAAFPPLPSSANIAPASVNDSLAESVVSSNSPHTVVEGSAQDVARDVKNDTEDIEHNEIL